MYFIYFLGINVLRMPQNILCTNDEWAISRRSVKLFRNFKNKDKCNISYAR